MHKPLTYNDTKATRPASFEKEESGGAPEQRHLRESCVASCPSRSSRVSCARSPAHSRSTQSSAVPATPVRCHVGMPSAWLFLDAMLFDPTWSEPLAHFILFLISVLPIHARFISARQPSSWMCIWYGCAAIAPTTPSIPPFEAIACHRPTLMEKR